MDIISRISLPKVGGGRITYENAFYTINNGKAFLYSFIHLVFIISAEMTRNVG